MTNATAGQRSNLTSSPDAQCRERGGLCLPTRQLGRSSVNVTVLGLGGAPYAQADTAAADDESRSLIAHALDRGVRYFDTAPLYGIGLSERRLGNGLLYADRTAYTISTKVGRYLLPDVSADSRRSFTAVVDYGYDAAMRAIEQSLQRLGLNRVDILLIHDLDIWTHGTRALYEQRLKEALNGAYRALASLRDQGVVGAIGIGVNEIEPCLRFIREADPDCVMLAGRYTLLEQDALNELLPLCERRAVSVLVAGPYNSGVLATGVGAEAQYNYRQASPTILDQVGKLQTVAERHGVEIGACALQFVLAHPAVVAVVPGAKNRHEVDTNLDLLAAPIPQAMWEEMRHLGLIHADAPTPVSGSTRLAVHQT